MLALPSDCLAKVCAFLRARETVLLTGLGTSVLEALESDAFLWGEAVRREHGGLRLAPADARCRYARCALRTLAALRLFRERVLGGGEPLAFRGLATDGGVDDGQMAYWVDALFRPEPWFVYSSAATRRLVLCAAVFEGDAPDASRDDDRDWMLERLRVAGRLLGDDFLENGLDAEPPLALELTFYEIARAMDAQGWLREISVLRSFREIWGGKPMRNRHRHAW